LLYHDNFFCLSEVELKDPAAASKFLKVEKNQKIICGFLESQRPYLGVPPLECQATVLFFTVSKQQVDVISWGASSTLQSYAFDSLNTS
jgi:hypothetical protein